MQYSQEHLKTMVYAEFGGQTECIMGNWKIENPGQKSLRQYCNIHIFLSFLGSFLKRCTLFEVFLQFSLPPPYTKLKLGKKFWIHASNIVCGVRVGGWTCVHWKSPQKRKSVPGLLSMIHYWSQPCEICVKIV